MTYKLEMISNILNLSMGVLPETLRRGPYAVVERAERAKSPSSLVEIKLNYCGVFCYFFSPCIQRNAMLCIAGYFATLIPLIIEKCDVMCCGVFCYFLDPCVKRNVVLCIAGYFDTFWTLVTEKCTRCETVAFGNYAGSSKSGIVLHRPKILQSKLEDAEVKYKGKMDKDHLTKWILDNYHSLAGHRTMDNMREFKCRLC